MDNEILGSEEAKDTEQKWLEHRESVLHEATQLLEQEKNWIRFRQNYEDRMLHKISLQQLDEINKSNANCWKSIYDRYRPTLIEFDIQTLSQFDDNDSLQSIRKNILNLSIDDYHDITKLGTKRPFCQDRQQIRIFANNFCGYYWS